MKKVIYIAFVVVGLLAVSCSKENIRPIATNSEETPVWRSSSTIDSGNGSTSTEPGSITDPNNDEDGGKRKRQ
jgi:hypothetical protein